MVTGVPYRPPVARKLPPIATHDDLVDALRQVEGLRDKGKVHPNFQLRSRPFLHFHRGERGVYADVRFGDEFEPVPANTPAQRAVLLDRVRRHVEAASSRKRTG